MQPEVGISKKKGENSFPDRLEPAEDFDRILAQVRQKTGVDVQLYRTATLERRMSLRLAATRSKSYREYLAVLKKNPAEYKDFLQTLTIPVTDFFRDKDIYKNLKVRVLPAIINRAEMLKRKRISIWSVGCSKGQEPYSLAMLLLKILGTRQAELRFAIQATDLNNTLLKKANAGAYTLPEVKSVPRTYLRDYFSKNGNMYHIKPSVRRLVKFRHQDLIREKPGGKFDLILCRNVLIFFKPRLRQNVLKNFHSSLCEKGILVLGTAESLNDKRLFHCLSPRDHFFQKVQ